MEDQAVKEIMCEACEGTGIGIENGRVTDCQSCKGVGRFEIPYTDDELAVLAKRQEAIQAEYPEFFESCTSENEPDAAQERF